ncbi:hypothetical protein Acsp03_24660 [Actinomadura sp. NBRC 104412]|uniref:hypothetical protein n=1 Tax=Actinomadura sp. NBRC 104412 TaxID=3032203 RepID=UPI0024A1FA28|nr:hypothetical protein [Actinomadura sp. NBRC 104412]GLZ05000.1 hypothetical protein Acsp03_24660 [Actinomadura sp. NBRC 104412]
MKTKGSFRPEDVQLDIGDGVKIPNLITVSADEVGGYAVELMAEYDDQAGRYVARMAVVRAGDGAEVTGEVLRSIPLATILRDGVMDALRATLLLSGARPPVDAGKTGPTTETLRWVARIYRLAVLLGDAPTQAVASGLGVPRSTAGRWVTRARDRGLLTVVDPRASRVE